MHIELLSLVDQISERSEQELSNVINLKVSIWLLLSLFDILFQDISKLNQFSKLNSEFLNHLIVVIYPPGLVPFHNSSEFLMKESQFILHIACFLSFIKLLLRWLSDISIILIFNNLLRNLFLIDNYSLVSIDI